MALYANRQSSEAKNFVCVGSTPTGATCNDHNGLLVKW